MILLSVKKKFHKLPISSNQLKSMTNSSIQKTMSKKDDIFNFDVNLEFE